MANNDSEFANFRGIKSYKEVPQDDAGQETAVELVLDDGTRTGPFHFSWNKMIQLRTRVARER